MKYAVILSDNARKDGGIAYLYNTKAEAVKKAKAMAKDMKRNVIVINFGMGKLVSYCTGE